MPSRRDVVECARTFLGTRWRHQGRLKGSGPSSGVDCAGLVIKVAHELGLFTYDYTDYTRQGDWGAFVGRFREHMIESSLDKAKPGSILILRESAYPCHCGIVSKWEQDDRLFIHAYAVQHKVIEDVFNDEWRSMTITVFEYPGLDEE